MDKMPVGVLGATGMVGQRLIELLEGHPWFEVSFVGASERSAGKTYEEAVQGRWHSEKPLPSGVKSMTVRDVSDIGYAADRCSFVFSALETDAAARYERQYASAGLPVVSNASAHRHDTDVPVLIPEINYGHLGIIPVQRKNRGWDRGFIAVKPNCSIQSYMIPLHALQAYGIGQVLVTTMQAVSGAGYPGVASLDIIDNIVPFISGEEEKSEREPLKIWGRIEGNGIADADGIRISAHCNRVPVLDGHMACVSVSFGKKPPQEKILELWRAYRSVPQELGLPSAPEHPVVYMDEPDRPQSRLDRYNGDGMAVTVGRLRPCNVLDYRFVGLSHNLVRGAAGGNILNAELLTAEGYLK